MANLINAVGYSLGKLHSGMIAYLCELYRDGSVEPLTSFFGSLGIKIPEHLKAEREWHSVDLAIIDEDNDKPQILIEMKVDDHEKNEKNSQTKRYADEFPECPEYRYITLGMGEYFRKPYGSKFKWIRLRDFSIAVDRIAHKDKSITDWAEALHNEMDLQDRVRDNDTSRLQDYRSGAWNIYFLGLLKESFERRYHCGGDGFDPTCYTYGQRPDTILNFGWDPDSYLEINANGVLHLKINLEDRSDAEKRLAVEDLKRKVRAKFSRDSRVSLSESQRVGKSKTVASFDIGLFEVGGALQYKIGQEETIRRLLEFLEPFYTARNL